MAILCPLALGLGQGKMKIDRALTQMRRDVSERAERARARARESERAKGIALLRRRGEEREEGGRSHTSKFDKRVSVRRQKGSSLTEADKMSREKIQPTVQR